MLPRLLLGAAGRLPRRFKPSPDEYESWLFRRLENDLVSSEGVGGELQPLDPDVKLCVENGAASKPGTAVAI